MIKFEYFPNKKQCRVSGLIFDEVREHFSVKNETAFFARKFGRRFIPDRTYCITPTGLFDSGMFYDIYRYVKNAHPNIQIDISQAVRDVVKPSLEHCEIYDKLNLNLRDYQIETVSQALKFGRGIIKLGTGGGKTLTIASLLSSLYINKGHTFKCLLIVPDLTLVNQTYNDFNEYGVKFKITRWTGSISPDFTANVIIANLGILQSQFVDEEWLTNVDALIVDECHKLKKGNKACKIVKSIKTGNKFGLTGTLPDTKIDEWNIIGLLGSVFYEKNSYELRTENYLTNAEIKIIKIKYVSKVQYIQGANKFRTELDFIYNNSYRNNVIKAISNKCNNNVLILVNHISHGEKLFEHLSSTMTDRKVYFIRGEVEVEERSRVIKEMEANNNVVCIAISAIFSTGVNVKNLHMIIFASGGKSFIRTIQSIGRGLRLNPNKEKLIIMDIADNLRYSESHAIKRQQIYTQEKIQFQIGELVEK